MDCSRRDGRVTFGDDKLVQIRYYITGGIHPSHGGLLFVVND